MQVIVFCLFLHVKKIFTNPCYNITQKNIIQILINYFGRQYHMFLYFP